MISTIMLITIIVIIFILLILWYITTMNKLRGAEIKIDEALSDIDVALIKRHDVLIKMLDICKNYAKYEKETLLATINLRSNMSVPERNQAVDDMDEASKFVQVVAENYPQLQSSDNFRQLQIAVMNVEEHLQAARRLYNGNITYLNQKIVSFPSSIVANMLHIKQKDFLEVEQDKKQDIKMDF